MTENWDGERPISITEGPDTYPPGRARPYGRDPGRAGESRAQHRGPEERRGEERPDIERSFERAREMPRRAPTGTRDAYDGEPFGEPARPQPAQERPRFATGDGRAAGDGQPEDGHLSTAELLKKAYGQIQTLVRDEIKLAKVELINKAKGASMGAAFLAGAAGLGLLSVLSLLTAVIALLALAVPLWLSALLIGLGLLLATLLAVSSGLKRLRSATPPFPREAAAETRADVNAVRTAVSERRHR